MIVKKFLFIPAQTIFYFLSLFLHPLQFSLPFKNLRTQHQNSLGRFAAEAQKVFNSETTRFWMQTPVVEQINDSRLYFFNADFDMVSNLRSNNGFFDLPTTIDLFTTVIYSCKWLTC